MAQLEELARRASVRSVLPRCLVTALDVRWHGSTAKSFKTTETSVKRLVKTCLCNEIEMLESCPRPIRDAEKGFLLLSEGHV